MLCISGGIFYPSQIRSFPTERNGWCLCLRTLPVNRCFLYLRIDKKVCGRFVPRTVHSTDYSSDIRTKINAISLFIGSWIDEIILDYVEAA